jgi:hypothetical protein
LRPGGTSPLRFRAFCCTVLANVRYHPVTALAFSAFGLQAHQQHTVAEPPQEGMMDPLSIPPQHMDLAIAVVSAILTPPILEQRRAFTATAGRDPTEGEMEQLRRTVLAEWSHVMRHIRSVAR